MLNVNDLELRYKNYKTKQYLRYSIIFTSFVVIFISLYLYNQNKFNTITQDIQKHTTLEANISNYTQSADANNSLENQKKNTSKEKQIDSLCTIKDEPKMQEAKNENIQKINKVLLTPSLGFIKNIEMSSLKIVKKKIDTKKKTTAFVEQEKEIAQNKIALPKEEAKIEAPIIRDEEKGSINIERKKDNDYIESVINRFKSNNNPKLSLFIANKYYQQKKYDRAYDYALITNNINSNIEESWTLFSKSLVKMNKKNMAIKTLKQYISHSNSHQAKQLLDEILSGKFK